MAWVILRREKCAELYLSTFQGFFLFIFNIAEFLSDFVFQNLQLEGGKITHNTVDVGEICGPSQFLLTSNSTVSLMS